MPPEAADVSVIVPAYRAAATIGRAFAGVAAQTLRPREVVVVDDGSDDGTTDAARDAAARLEGIALKLVRQEHQGAGAARNRAVIEAAQPLVAFLDADDEWLPRHLERALAHLERGGHVLVAHNGWRVEAGRQTLIDGARHFREGGDPFVALYRKGYIDTCTVVARRAAVLAAGGFDPGLANGQDFDMWLAMLRPPGTGFVVFDEPLSRYHVRPASIMSHTERRLGCGLVIAGRYAHDLRSRRGSALASLWYRTAAVHYEAAAAHGARRDLGWAAWTCCKLPGRLLRMTFGYLFRRPESRGDFIAAASAAAGQGATGTEGACGA